MTIDREKKCKAIATIFFVLVTAIELSLFGNLFDVFVSPWGRIMAVCFTIITFNVALWFFALKYYETLHKPKTRT